MDQQAKLKAAKDYVVATMTDIIIKNYDENGPALETPGTFTALLEAYRAIQIAERSDADTPAERAQDEEDYRQGVLRNQE